MSAAQRLDPAAAAAVVAVAAAVPAAAEAVPAAESYGRLCQEDSGAEDRAGFLAAAVHWGFYAVMILMPVTGWIMVSTSRFALPTVLYGAMPWPHPIRRTIPCRRLGPESAGRRLG